MSRARSVFVPVVAVMLAVLAPIPGSPLRAAPDIPASQTVGSLSPSTAAVQLELAQQSLRAGANSTIDSPSTCSGAQWTHQVCHPALPSTGGAHSLGPNWSHPGSSPIPPEGYTVAMAYDEFDGYVLLVTAGQTWRYSPTGWTELHPDNQPPAVSEATMVYDPHDGCTVYYGGYSIGYYDGNYDQLIPRNYTWAFRGDVWTNLTHPIAPPPARGATLSYDTWDGYVLLFNGLSKDGTWEFSAGNWTAVPFANGDEPSPRYGPAFVDDPRDGSVLLFGGAGVAPGWSCNCSDVEFNDTWVFHSGSWQNLTKDELVSPSPRDRSTVAYDATEGEVMLWGGVVTAHGQVAPADAWTFSRERWSFVNRTDQAPPFHFGAAATFVSASNSVFVYGGVDELGVATDQAWTFTSSGWTSAFVLESPPASGYASMAYDGADGYVVLFDSGGAASLGPESQTWSFLNGVWTELAPPLQPSPRAGASMAYDPEDGYVVLFGGVGATGDLNETWSFSGGRWTNLTNSARAAPEPRDSAALTWDSEDGYLLLFGGFNSSTGNAVTSYGRDDTWSFVGGDWTNRSTSGPRPGVRYGASLADDRADRYVLLFGGEWGCDWCANWVAYNDTWTYRGGTWTLHNLSINPSPTSYEVLADDPSSGGIVLFGGTAYGEGETNVTWFFYHGNWTELNLTTAPAPVWGFGYSTDPNEGGVLVFGGASYDYAVQATWLFQFNPMVSVPVVTPEFGNTPLTIVFNQTTVGGTAPVRFNWTFGDGSHSSGATVTHTFDLPGLYWATLNATDSNRNWSQSSFPIAAGTNLSAYATALSLNGTAPLDSELLGSASGGLAPYNYTWTFGDGSPAATGSFVNHVFQFAGAYRAVLTVRDAENFTATVGVNIRVGPVPLVVQLTSNVTRGDAPLGVAFNDSIAGGTPPYNLSWTFGDGGKAKGAAPAHTFRSAGDYLVQLTVTDANDASVTADVEIDVAGALQVSVAWVSRGTPSSVTVSFTGSLIGGQGPYSVLWDFGDGSYSDSLNGSHVYDFPGTYQATLRVSDSNGRSTEVGPFYADVAAPPPALYATLIGSAVTVAPDASLILTADPIGGTGSFHFDWIGLPTGCGNADFATITCHPIAVGTFGVTVSITDGAGQVANASTAVSVFDPSLSILLLISPNPAAESTPTSIRAITLGGTAPFAFRWTGLPPGCSTSDSENLTCAPTSPGSWLVHATVTDPYGLTAGANGTLAVQPAASPASVAGPTSPPWELLWIGLAAGVCVAAGVWVIARVIHRTRD